MWQERAVRILSILPIILFCFGLWSDSYAFRLPDTNQTKCYQDVSPYAEIACPSPGSPLAQDGSYNINPKSYTVIGNNSDMVQDNNTGLIWQRQDDGNAYNWYQAMGEVNASYNPSGVSFKNVCGNLQTGGYSDWRVPSKKELITIVDYSVPYPGPTIYASYFLNTQPLAYWTSTPYAPRINDSWLVAFYGGSVSYNIQSNVNYVRCVRGVQSSPTFTDNGNGTVTDQRTNLMWQQGETGTMLWGAALNYCEGLTLPSGGYSDWRLPNIIELESITDDTVYDPINHPIAIDTSVFPNAAASTYWSSTTVTYSSLLFVYDPSNAWLAGFDFGYIDAAGKNGAGYVRCVRAGQFGNLTISKTGAGSGIVVSSPAGINCGATCSAYYPIGSAVKLATTPSTGGSIFFGWDLNCNNGAVTMNADVSCTATFELCPGTTRARIGLTPYDSISQAYGAAANGDTIEVIASNQQEYLNLNRGIIVTLSGGFDCSFNPMASYTTVTGYVLIATGKLTVSNMVIQ